MTSCDNNLSNYCSVDGNEHVTGLDVIAINTSRPDAVVVFTETRHYTPVIPRTPAMNNSTVRRQIVVVTV